MNDSLAGGSCEPLGPKAESKSPRLEIRRVVPAGGRVVTRGTLLVASLAYSIPDYKGDTYSLTAQFDSIDPSRTTGGLFAFQFEVFTCGPTGILSFALPLEHVWRNPRVKHPLRLRFFLLDAVSRPALVIASSEIVEYSSSPVMSPNGSIQGPGSR